MRVLRKRLRDVRARCHPPEPLALRNENRWRALDGPITSKA